MVNNVYKFRRIKWGDPRPKLKVLSEDFRRRLWLDRLSPLQFWALTALSASAAFIVVLLGLWAF
jgi:hypothetical protein